MNTLTIPFSGATTSNEDNNIVVDFEDIITMEQSSATKTLVYGPPVVVNTRQLHSARANDIKRFGFQIDFDYNMNIDEVYNAYKTSEWFLN